MCIHGLSCTPFHEHIYIYMHREGGSDVALLPPQYTCVVAPLSSTIVTILRPTHLRPTFVQFISYSSLPVLLLIPQTSAHQEVCTNRIRCLRSRACPRRASLLPQMSDARSRSERWKDRKPTSSHILLRALTQCRFLNGRRGLFCTNSLYTCSLSYPFDYVL